MGSLRLILKPWHHAFFGDWKEVGEATDMPDPGDVSYRDAFYKWHLYHPSAYDWRREHIYNTDDEAIDDEIDDQDKNDGETRL
jgi:hypothetical protein